MIVDDEPKIRRGLHKLLPWEEFGVEIAGEAEDGNQALELARKLSPDILFVDINMPFLNGLDLIERLKREMKGCILIVITGHDEFVYAQKAVKLGVFDFILKPVTKTSLEHVITRATEELTDMHRNEEHRQWIEHQLQTHFVTIRDTFLARWLDGLIPNQEIIRKNLEYFGFHFGTRIGMGILKVIQTLDTGPSQRVWDKGLLEFSAKNVTEELVGIGNNRVVFQDGKGHVVWIAGADNMFAWAELCKRIRNKLEGILEKVVLMEHQIMEDDIQQLPLIYRSLLGQIRSKSSLSPIVLLAKSYIDHHYQQPDLSLRDVADGVQVSPAYLSKQLKRELGLSFIDYLTEVRIRHAIRMMQDPTVKVYEIAEKVGYSSQHYFSNAFKKMTGLSPLQYRKGKRV